VEVFTIVLPGIPTLVSVLNNTEARQSQGPIPQFIKQVQTGRHVSKESGASIVMREHGKLM
jgi:hypothetical protein